LTSGSRNLPWASVTSSPQGTPNGQRRQSAAISRSVAQGFLFRTADGRSERLTANGLTQPDAYRMIQRRAAAAGVVTKIGCHSWRARGITAYLENGGLLEHAQQMAAHSSARTTKLYDRRGEMVSAEEVGKIWL
jgi:integrase